MARSAWSERYLSSAREPTGQGELAERPRRARQADPIPAGRCFTRAELEHAVADLLRSANRYNGADVFRLIGKLSDHDLVSAYNRWVPWTDAISEADIWQSAE